MNKLNNLYLPSINVEAELDAVKVGSGTYKEIEQAVANGDISLLKDNTGDVIGINYNSGKTGAEDTVERMKFAKRYFGHDVAAYVYKAVTGEELDYDDDYEDELPNRLIIPLEELDGVVNEKTIAKYLRDNFNHYLSGVATPQFYYDIEENEYEDEEYVIITDICWGRKK